VKETTVDFVVQFKTGTYLCKKKVNNLYKMNHLNAYSFDTYRQANIAARGAKVIKRVCTLEVIEERDR